MLLVVCLLLFDVWCLSVVVCCLLSFVVQRMLFVFVVGRCFGCELFLVCRVLLLDCLLFVGRCLLLFVVLFWVFCVWWLVIVVCLFCCFLLFVSSLFVVVALVVVCRSVFVVVC